jgi:hypothetical protein
MTQKVISARDVELWLKVDALAISYKLETASNFTANITGNTEDIGAIGTDEPIATDQGGTSYDLSFTLQNAEALLIKDAMAAATAASPDGSISHIRQIVEDATISVVWKRKRDVTPNSVMETYSFCTGVEENDSVERRASETLKVWRWRARGLKRQTVPL